MKSEKDTTVQAYVVAYPEFIDRIHTLRDEILYENGLDEYTKSGAHITLYPLFRVQRKQIPKIRSVVNQLGIAGRKIQFTGLETWPSRDNPRIIQLGCDFDVTEERQQISDYLESVDSILGREPVPTHLTLLENNDSSHLDEEVKDRIQSEVEDRTEEWETRIKYVDVVVKDNA